MLSLSSSPASLGRMKAPESAVARPEMMPLPMMRFTTTCVSGTGWSASDKSFNVCLRGECGALAPLLLLKP